MSRNFDYLYIFATLSFTVYGQLIVKWRIAQFVALQAEQAVKLRFLLGLLFEPLIFSGFVAAFLASLAWMAAMTKFELTHAYPFLSLNYVLILTLSSWVLNEQITSQKILGISLIVLSTFIATRG